LSKWVATKNELRLLYLANLKKDVIGLLASEVYPVTSSRLPRVKLKG
jgi:hypothetical protein